MKFKKIFIIVLSLITIFNVIYYKSSNENIKKLTNVLIWNEYSARLKQWRNFNNYLEFKTQNYDTSVNSSEKNLILKTLNNPTTSLLWNINDTVNTATIDCNYYLKFIDMFDDKYIHICNMFNKKNKSISYLQLKEINIKMHESYNLLLNNLTFEVKSKNNKSKKVYFYIEQDILDNVLKILDDIEQILEKIK